MVFAIHDSTVRTPSKPSHWCWRQASNVPAYESLSWKCCYADWFNW